MTASDTPAIEVRQLFVELNGRRVLNHVDLSVAAGEIVAILGANGAGKTTLLRCCAGLKRHTSGEVLWLGQLPRQNIELKRSIGMAGHQRALYGELTPRENLLFAAELCDVSNATHRVEQMLTDAGLQRHAGLQTRRLSHGLQQRLSLCRALVHDPSIVLLDEPSCGLDEQGQQWLRQLLLQLKNRGKSICLATHEPWLAHGLADRVLRLERGELSLQEVAWRSAA
jgi:heme ABC exporter ATP-binding subunit CcmA